MIVIINIEIVIYFKKKCRKYWPTADIMYGDIQVKKESSDSSSCYKVRRFQITLVRIFVKIKCHINKL